MTSDEAISALWRAGRDAWPEIPLPEDDFVAWQSERGAADPSVLVGADLYLACGCLLGVRGAVERFVSGPLAAAARHVPSSIGGADDIVQELAMQLLTPGADGSPPRLSQYSGRGALAVWLRMAVTRRALNANRGRDRTVSLDALPWERPGVHDPEASALRRHYGPELRRVFAEAAAATSPEDRTLLRMHYVNGATLTELAALHRTSRSAMHRRLEAARGALMDRIRVSLRAQMRLSESEYGSMLLLFQSDVREVVGRLLRGD